MLISIEWFRLLLKTTTSKIMKRAYLIIALVAISLTEVYAKHEVGTLTVQPRIGRSV